MDVSSPALIITAPAQLITAPAQPPATGVVVYTALFHTQITVFFCAKGHADGHMDGRTNRP